MLDNRQRYLQIAFNDDVATASGVLLRLPKHDRILVEAGTPFIKQEGFSGIKRLVDMWGGYVVADLKTMDGALDEVSLAHDAGASAATVLGAASIETLDLFIAACNKLDMDSMIDMIGVDDPLKVLRRLREPPTVVILHKGRDEENTKGKVIPYKQVNKIRSKFDLIISAAGGIDLREARSAIFNGANIVVANLVGSGDSWTGIDLNDDIAAVAEEFLKTIE